MKTLEIRIKSIAQANEDFVQTFKNLQAGKRVAPNRGVYFTSLDAVRNLLTEKRMGLLHLIREKSPKSIYALAKLAGRNFKNVHSDLKILKDYGLVKMTSTRHHKKNASQRVTVPYQSINIHAGI